MSKQKYFKEISEKVTMLEKAKNKLNTLQNDVYRMDARINTLEQQMDENPTYEIAHELGSLKQGKEPFEKSLAKHKEEYQKLVESKKISVKSDALKAIEDGLASDSELIENRDELLKMAKKFVELSNSFENNFYNKRQEIMDEISDLGASQYIDFASGSYYPDPYQAPNNVPEQVIKQLNSYLENETKE